MDWKNPDYDSVVRERIARLEALRKDPKYDEMVTGLNAFYADNPAQFISDWGSTFDPRLAEVGKNPTIPFVLFKRQEEYISWLLERWLGREDGLVEKSRDMGVTWLCVGFAVWMWRYRPGSVVGFGSRTEDLVDKKGDPDSIFWKVRFFIEMLPTEFVPKGYRREIHSPFMRIVNPENGAVIRGEGGDNLGRGGRSSIYFVDEAAYIARQKEVDAALSMTSNCKVWVSTPNGAGNVFYQKRHGGKVRVFIFDWRQDPRKGKDWYEEQVAKLDPVVLAQEVDRDYESSMGDAWIDGPRVTAAMLRGPADVPAIGGLRVGLDVARFGDDKSVLTFRKGRVLLKQVLPPNKLDLMSCASWARNEIRAYKETPEQIAVDVIGLGAGVADILRSDGYYPNEDLGRGRYQQTVVDVNSSHQMNDGENFNLRAYMAREVKDWMATASIPNDADLKSDLTCFKYGFKHGGLLFIEEKDQVKKRLGRSPDRYDSLALTFAHPTLIEQEPPPVSPYRMAVPGVM
jgi:phage terminase large subunit